jgi:DNA-nicking Smr family endonuclease
MTTSEGPRRRKLSHEEHALWHTVTRSITPLGRRRRGDDGAGTPELDAAGVAKVSAAKTLTPPAVPKSAPKPLPLASLDRRTRQRLARGTESIDGRLDLHGRTQSQAHTALLRFLRRAQANGAKTVLVITGKGAGDGDRGVLRRQVPQWLELPEFRLLVLGFSDAGVGHGGAGALYVRLRRAR